MKMNPSMIASIVQSCFLAVWLLLTVYTTAAATLSGSVSGTLTRANSPYLVTSDTFVFNGQTLTIEPGVVIQFQNADTALIVDGVLLARGSAAEPIRFTSDDNAKAPGQWETILFRSGGTNSIMEHCVVEYGGALNLANENIRVESSSPRFLNCAISHSRLNGITLIASDSRIENCRFTENAGGFALAMRTDSMPLLRNNSAIGNGKNAIGVFGSSINRDGTWLKDNFPYTIIEDTFISNGRKLTIEPGVTVQFQDPDDALIVDGALIAQGTEASPIRFTSDEPHKEPGQWEAILIRGSADDEITILEHCIVESAGALNLSDENIRLEGASPTIRRCIISNGRRNGIKLNLSDAIIQNCQFLNNGTTNNGFAIAMRTDSLPRLSGNNATGNGRDAIGIFGSNVTRDGTWVKDNLPYTIVEDTFIFSGRTLTIEPGVIIQFQDPDDALIIDGTFIAKGTATSPIRFTSDDSTKAPGQWEAIIFRDSSDDSRSIMEHCIVEYAGSEGLANESVRLEFASPTLLNSTFSNNRLQGLTLIGSDARIENCHFSTNGAALNGYAMAMRTDSAPKLVNNSASANGRNAIGIYGSVVNRNVTWMKDNLPYTIVEDTFVYADRILTIEAGVTIQFQDPDDALLIDGALVAQSTEANPIRFTSDEAQKASGQWEALIFRDSSDDAVSILEHCIVEYAGAAGLANECIRLEAASPTIRSCTISNSRINGITLIASDPRIENCLFIRNGPTESGFAVAMRTDSAPRLLQNRAVENGKNAIAIYGGSVNRNATWARDNIPYTVVEDTFVFAGRTLTIEPGVILQFQDTDDALIIDGAFIARGTETSPIRFTSDDQQKQPGQWESIVFRDSSDDARNVLEYALLEYGGAFSEGILQLYAASPQISRSTIQRSLTDGIHISAASPKITNSRIQNNGRDGIRTLSQANPVITGNSLSGNNEFAIRNLDTARIVDARSNYWGDPSGPLDMENLDSLNLTNPAGKGGKVSEYVNWGTPLTTNPSPEPETRPSLETAPGSLAFGTVNVGQNKELDLIVRNIGLDALIVQSATVNNSRFTVLSPVFPITLSPNTQQNVQIRFTPTGGGEQTGNLSLVSNDTNNPTVTIPLSGSGATGGGVVDCPTLPAGIIAWWRGDGDATDARGSSHGTFTNPDFVAGKVAQAFKFDGINQYIGTPLEVQPSAVPITTWEGWVYPTRPGGRQQILSSDDGGYDRSVLVEGESFAVFTGWGSWVPTTAAFNQWQHIAVIFTTNNVEFYKNGVRFSYGAAPVGQSTGYKLQIGRNPGFGEFFHGLIDEISIYNRALTSDEIQSIVASGSAGKCGLTTDGGRISTTPGSLDFGTVAIGQSLDVNFALKNTGSGNLSVTAIMPSNPAFSIVSPALPATISAGQTQFVAVRFAPSAAGLQSDLLGILSSDSVTGPLHMPVRGTGAINGATNNTTLNVQQTGAGIELVWPAVQTGYRLEATTSLSLPIRWRPITNTPVIVNGQYILLLEPSLLAAPSMYFRVVTESAVPSATSTTASQIADTFNAFGEVSPAVSGDQFQLLVRREIQNLRNDLDTFDAELQMITAQADAVLSFLSQSATISSLAAPSRSREISLFANSGFVPGPLTEIINQFKQVKQTVDDLKKVKTRLKDGSDLLDLLMQNKSLEELVSARSALFKQISDVFKKMREDVDEPLGAMLSGRAAGVPDDVEDFNFILEFVKANDSRLAELMAAPGFTIDSYRRLNLTDKQRDLVAQAFRSSTARGRLYLRDHLLGFLNTLASAGVEAYSSAIIDATGGGKIKSAAELTKKIYDFLSKEAGVPQGILRFNARPRFLRNEGSTGEAKADLFLVAQLPDSKTRLATFLISGQNVINERGDILLTQGLQVPALRYDVLVVPRNEPDASFKLLPFATTVDANAQGFIDLPLVYDTKLTLNPVIKQRSAGGSQDDSSLSLDQYKELTVRVDGFPQSTDGPMGAVFDTQLRPDGSVRSFYVIPFLPPSGPLALAIQGSPIEDFSQTVTLTTPQTEMPVNLFRKGGGVFVRQDPPMIQVGSASFAGDLVITNNGAYVSVSGAQARLQWNEPPQQLSPGQSFTITVNADANSAPAQTQFSSTSPASPRSLFADVNRFVSNFADDAAFIGYVDRIEPCNGRCYKLGHRSVTRTITAGQEEFTVTISLASYGGLTYGGSGERKGSVTWRYVRK